MTKFIGWSQRAGVILATLLILGWATLYFDEWMLRWRGEALLQKIKTVEVDHSLENDILPMISEWRATQDFSTYCDDAQCTYMVRYHTHTPSVFRGEPDGSKLARILDYSGLRLSMVMGSVSAKHGVVVGKSFGAFVALPVRVWFDRDGAYVPDLAVASSEIGVNDNYKFSLGGSESNARHVKGPYGLSVSFASSLEKGKKENLTDFHLQCVTQLFPCLNERDILKSGERLLEGNAN